MVDLESVKEVRLIAPGISHLGGAHDPAPSSLVQKMEALFPKVKFFFTRNTPPKKILNPAFTTRWFQLPLLYIYIYIKIILYICIATYTRNWSVHTWISSLPRLSLSP